MLTPSERLARAQTYGYLPEISNLIQLLDEAKSIADTMAEAAYEKDGGDEYDQQLYEIWQPTKYALQRLATDAQRALAIEARRLFNTNPSDPEVHDA